MYTRQGYLYVQLKNKSMPFNVVAGSQWIKHYCQYQAKSKTLTMIPYNQLQGKITTTETVKVNNCLCKTEDSAEKFRFVVHGEDLTQVITSWSESFGERDFKPHFNPVLTSIVRHDTIVFCGFWWHFVNDREYILHVLHGLNLIHIYIGETIWGYYLLANFLLVLLALNC